MQGMMRTVYNESFDLGLSMSESYELFRHLLLKHSCHRPPFSSGIFNLNDVKAISDYVLDTFFRHYKMYTNWFHPNLSVAFFLTFCKKMLS